MPLYKAPLRDYEFCLNELFADEQRRRPQCFADITPDVVAQILAEGAKFAEQILHPLNLTADEESCRLTDGAVTTPKGFKEAYRQLAEGGWPGLTCDPAHGGQGLPHVVNFLFEEMICAASLSFSLYAGLTRGAYVAVARHAGAELQALYAPRLASGEWAGAMCLTESHSGTDLGLLRTSAVPNADGSHALTGTKIFISAGEHDLTPNIVYLVLARLPAAPKGTKGISLFLVPKFLCDAQGTLGARNAVSCSALEQKMGIHGCSTCVMNFDGATGWLVGEPHQGLKAMFAMMNAERIAVGIQGLAIAEASYQNAVAYARERLQSRSPKGAQLPDKPADPIIMQPDVRRMLMTQRALIEGCRMLALWTALWLDAAERHPDESERQRAGQWVALLTPVVKAFLTDSGSEVANLGMQVFGGHGYIRANGQEQLVRDARITQIYEGTNGVQAMDLLGRKVLSDGGKALALFAVEIGHHLKSTPGDFTVPLARALQQLQDATAYVMQQATRNPEAVGAAAVPYLRLFALTAIGYLFSRAAVSAAGRNNEPFYAAKLATARFFGCQLLPQADALFAAITAGAEPVMAMDEMAF